MRPSRVTLGALVKENAMSRAAAKPASGGMPADIEANIRMIGPVIDPPETAAVYAPLHAKEPYAGVKVTRDIKYAGDTRHALDVFAPETAGGPRPVFVFIHGGGYTGGHKREGDNFFYDNIMLWAVRHGMVGVNATYRLAPQHAWPAGAEDVGAAVRWAIDNIAKFGGDPKRIFLAGHSAGGTHAGTYVAMEQFHAPGGPNLAGLILLSGNYDLSSVPADERYATYFGPDQSQYSARSPFAGLLRTTVPIFAAWGEIEPAFLYEQSKNLVAALKKASQPVRAIELPGHSHISITYHINTDDTRLTDAMLEFIDDNK
jgi:acetyl esterase/lipase